MGVKSATRKAGRFPQTQQPPPAPGPERKVPARLARQLRMNRSTTQARAAGDPLMAMEDAIVEALRREHPGLPADVRRRHARDAINEYRRNPR